MEARHRFERLFLVLAISATSVVVFAQSSQFFPSVKNGDYNGDGSRNISDAVNMFRYLFTDRADPPAPVQVDCRTDFGDGATTGESLSPSLHNGDVDGDGSFNLADCIYFLNWLFAGGKAPIEIDCELME